MTASSDAIVIDEWSGGIGWIAQPAERMRRASHAIYGDSGAWLIDPVDTPMLDELVADVGDVAGIVVTLDRHTRDADRLAHRFDVAVHVPQGLTHLQRALTARGGDIAAMRRDTGFRPLSVVNLPGWREYALYNPDAQTILLAEALGTATYYCAPSERIGVHPVLRLVPPRSALGTITVERILVGHGRGIMEQGTEALHDALDGARIRAPLVYGQLLARAPTVLFDRLR